MAAPFDKRKRIPNAGNKGAKSKAASPPLPAEPALADVQPPVNSPSINEETEAKAAQGKKEGR